MEKFDKIKINYKFDGMTDVLIQDLKSLVEFNISGKMDGYFKKVFKKEDAEIKISIVVKKDKQDKYAGSFRFDVDGKMIPYQNDIPFKSIEDLVNHAFDRLKLELSDSK
ncbi:MAG: hypothetical protein V3575_06965 [Candidatus Absconditabacteria bacterium]